MVCFSLKNFPLEQKVVLVRADYNVPVAGSKVTDATKMKATLPTLQLLLQQNCRIIIMTHLGRPEGKIKCELSTKVLLPELQRLLPKKKIFHVPDCIGPAVKAAITSTKTGEILVLENLRFYAEEEADDAFFAQALASLAEVYVNDAFAVSHRKHASVHAITHYLPAIPGLLIQREIENLHQALRPLPPAVWLLGGAKLSKVDLIRQALHKAEYVLIGGALAFAFLKAQGIPVGMSKTDAASVRIASRILRSRAAKKIILPQDFLVAEKFSPQAKVAVVPFDRIQNHRIALDIGPATIKLFQHYLRRARTIVWNGPLGYYEWAKFAAGTKEMGRFIGRLTATSIAGGGETADALHKFHLAHNFTHVSTGGGAALEFLAGKKLLGIQALEENYEKWRKKVKV